MLSLMKSRMYMLSERNNNLNHTMHIYISSKRDDNISFKGEVNNKKQTCQLPRTLISSINAIFSSEVGILSSYGVVKFGGDVRVRRPILS